MDINPEYIMLAGILVLGGIIFFVLNGQTNLADRAEVAALRKQVAAQEENIHFLMRRVTEMDIEIRMLREERDVARQDARAAKEDLKDLKTRLGLNDQ